MPDTSRYETIVVLSLLSILVLLFTWPASISPSEYLLQGDPYLNTWILSWESEALFSAPLDIFNAPIMYPHQLTLAYTENLFGILPVFMIIKWLVGSDVAAFNIIWILSYILNSFVMYLFCRKQLKLHLLPSVFAAIVFGFGHYMFNHVYHIHILWAFPMILALWYAWKAVLKNSWKYTIISGLFFLWQSLCSLHYLAYLSLTLVIFVLFASLRKKLNIEIVIKFAVVGALCIVLLLPIVLPYHTVKNALGFERSEKEIIGGGGQLQQYLAPSPFSDFPYKFLLKDFIHGGKNLFPGLLASVFFVIGLRHLLSKSRKTEIGYIHRAFIWIAYSLTTLIGVLVLQVLFTGKQLGFFSLIEMISRPFILLPFILILLLWLRSRRQSDEYRLQHCLILLVIIGFFFSLGPVIFVNNNSIGTGVYSLFLPIPLMNAFRATSRWFIIALIGLAPLAAIGMQNLQKRIHVKYSISVPVLLCLIAIYEYAPLQEWNVPEVDKIQADLIGSYRKEKPVVLNLPIHLDKMYQETVYMLDQRTKKHVIVNGYSGFYPAVYQHLVSHQRQVNDGEKLRLLRSIDYDYLIVHIDRLNPEQRTQWLVNYEKPSENLLPVERTETALLFTVEPGHQGKYASLIIAPERERLTVSYAARETEIVGQHFLDIYQDGIHLKQIQIYLNEITDQIDLLTDRKFASTVEFYYSYLPTNNDNIPLDVKLVSGGRDPNYCVVGVNGRYFDRGKGINVYHFDSSGAFIEHKVFNTCWYEQESESLARYLTSVQQSGYLLFCARHYTGRNLSEKARNILRDFGLKSIAGIGEKEYFIGLVDLDQRKAIYDRVGNKRLRIVNSKSFDKSGFTLKISKSQ